MKLKRNSHYSLTWLMLFATFIVLSLPGCDCKKGSKTNAGDSKNQQKTAGREIYEGGYNAAGLKKKRPMFLRYHKNLEKIRSEIIPPENPDEVSLVFVGDVMMAEKMSKAVAADPSYPFKALMPLLTQADYTVCNLEGPVAVKAGQRREQWCYKVPPATLTGLKDAGFDAVSLGNNHAMDCRKGGMIETLKYLDMAGIAHFGAGLNKDQARSPHFVEVNGIRVAFIGGISPEIGLYDEKQMDDNKILLRQTTKQKKEYEAGFKHGMAGVFFQTPKTLKLLVMQAKDQADMVVVSLHMGVRYYRGLHKNQVALAEAAAEAGADLVIGHHAHFWQPVDRIGKTAVVYGVGNFAFGSKNTNADEALLVRAIFSKKAHAIDRLELFPIYIKNKDKKVRFQPKLLKGGSARAMLRDLNAWSMKTRNTEIKILRDRGVLDMNDPKTETTNGT